MIKTYEEIMKGIDNKIKASAQFGIRAEQMRYVEYDKDGRLVSFIAENKAKDFRR